MNKHDAEAHVTGRRVGSRFQQFPGYRLVQVQSAPLGCCTVSPQRIAALSGSLLKAPGSAGGYLLAAITDALAYPMMRARSADLAQESFPRPYARGPRRITEAEIGKWWPIIKAR